MKISIVDYYTFMDKHPFDRRASNSQYRVQTPAHFHQPPIAEAIESFQRYPTGSDMLKYGLRAGEDLCREGGCRRLEVGESCDINFNCKNNNCARESADPGAPKTCCRSGSSGAYAGFDYCYGMPSGTTCWSDAMCSSGNCKGNLSGLLRGKCT